MSPVTESVNAFSSSVSTVCVPDLPPTLLLPPVGGCDETIPVVPFASLDSCPVPY